MTRDLATVEHLVTHYDILWSSRAYLCPQGEPLRRFCMPMASSRSLAWRHVAERPATDVELLSSFEPHRGGAPTAAQLVSKANPKPGGRQFVSNSH
jgi:hypothetical protein